MTFTRQRSETMNTLLMLVLVQWMILPPNAYGYIDPGTGSYILQMALAALFGALFTVKHYWSRIKIFLRSVFGKKGDEQV